jgi:hypothetical protein
LAPFLVEPDGEDAKRSQDILLANEFANFTDERVVALLQRFLDKDNSASLKVRHCGIALAAFDCSSYPAADATATLEKLVPDLTAQIGAWTKRAGDKVAAHKLDNFDIHFICVPIPSAADFRSYFLELIGATS